MRFSFIFAVFTTATFETLRNLYGCGSYPGVKPEARSDPLLLVLLLLSLVLVYNAYPGWE